MADLSEITKKGVAAAAFAVAATTATAQTPEFELQTKANYFDKEPVTSTYSGANPLQVLHDKTVQEITRISARLVDKGVGGGVGHVGAYKSTDPKNQDNGYCEVQPRNPLYRWEVPVLNLLTTPQKKTADIELECQNGSGQKIRTDLDYKDNTDRYVPVAKPPMPQTP